jgi:hypothetical protein
MCFFNRRLCSTFDFVIIARILDFYFAPVAAAALPALRRMYSPSYFTPFPL